MSARRLRVWSAGGAGGRLRRAFTLTEMLVALFVLVIAIGIVAQVFSLTTQTAVTAAAIADAEANVRTLLDELEADLRFADPRKSVLVLHGRTQTAALTEDERVAQARWRVLTGDPTQVTTGFDARYESDSTTLARRNTPTSALAQFSDPRADILMFFTQRPLASRAPATADDSQLDPFQLSLKRGARSAPAQVVYGHASVVRVTGTPGAYTWGTVTHIETSDTSDDPYQDGAPLSPLPASSWTLARRQVLIEDVSSSFFVGTNPAIDWDPGGFAGGSDAATERVTRCYSLDSRFAGDAAPYPLSAWLRFFEPFDGNNDGDFIDGQDFTLTLRSPYGNLNGGSLPDAWSGVELDFVRPILYADTDGNGTTGDEANHFVAAIAEPLPVDLQSNIGLQALPGCAWFQVEFLLPEDPRNGRDHPDWVVSDNLSQRDDTPRWVEVEPGETYVFVPDTAANRELIAQQGDADLDGTPDNSTEAGKRLAMFAELIDPVLVGSAAVNPRPIRLWPHAIRITVRAFDPRGRMPEPIVRSIVHRFD